MFNQMTLGDEIKTAAGVLVSALVTFGVLDAGQSDAVNGLVVTAIAALLALGVKPLGPAA